MLFLYSELVSFAAFNFAFSQELPKQIMRIHPSVSTILTCFLICLLTNPGVKAADTTLIDVINLPYSINTVASDSAGTVWLTGARGLQYYDFEKETFITSNSSYKSHIIAEQGRVTKFISRGAAKSLENSLMLYLRKLIS